MKEIIMGVLNLPQRILLRWKRRSLRCSHQAVPMLGFGGVLEGQSIIHGGAVKLLPLRDAFRNNEKNFNILYLVSSAQPKFAEDLVSFCHRRGIPFVWNQNGVGYPAWAGSDSERHNAPMRRVRLQADYVIYQSIFCREAAEKFLGPSSVPSEVLFNPVNLQKFIPLQKRALLSPLRLLALGTHGYAERVFSTLQCLKIVRDSGQEAVLTIAGKFQWPHGELSVRREIERLGLTAWVTLLPPFTQDQASVLYQSHHIVLHPKYLDPCPTVVMEALASGCPVIGSATGGLPELVTNDCGFLIPAPISWDQMMTSTGAQLAEGVMNILPRWEAAAAAARARAMVLFDEERWVGRHREIFSSLLQNKK